MNQILLSNFFLGTIELTVLLGIPICFAWIWSLIDILKNNFKDSDKIVWFLVVILLPILGVILYLMIGRKQKIF